MDKRFKAQEKRTRRTQRKQAAESGETSASLDAESDADADDVEAASMNDPDSPGESS